MARAGMARWRSKNPANGEGDEVQRSLELLDRVLSEFDDLENGNVCGGAAPPPAPPPGPAPLPPEQQSPSLGHQSEDDGYMSMNGRRAAKSSPDEEEPPPPPAPPPSLPGPPPPEEAQRVISTLLPCVSPCSSTKRREGCSERAVEEVFPRGATSMDHELLGHRVTTATQTTLPKTRHQRPYGWQTGSGQAPFHLREPPPPQLRFASLPYDGALRLSQQQCSPPWLPPRTVPGAVERHREVRRRGSSDDSDAGGGGEGPCPPLRALDELADFSEDSLEELLPAAKRNSVAWEVSLDDADPLLTPGSTKVVGRRRRRSADHSSTGSIHKAKELEEWPDPPPSTEEEAASPFSDSYYDSSIANEAEENGFLPAGLSGRQPSRGGTYIVRKGRKKERKSLPRAELPAACQQHPYLSDLKRCSSTFDNIKSLLKDGLLEGLDEPPPDFSPPAPPSSLVRVVSLPTLATCDAQRGEDFSGEPRAEDVYHHRSKTDLHRLSRPHELAVTVEEEEDAPYCYAPEDCNGLDDQMSELRVSEEERKLIAQLERDNSGQFLDTSAESLLLGDRDFLGLKRRSISSDRRSCCSLSSRASSKENAAKNDGHHSREPCGLSTDSLNLYRDLPRHSVAERRQEFGRKMDGRLTESQEALLEGVKQDTSFKKRPDCLRSRSEEYAKTVDAGDVWLMAAELKKFHAVPAVEGSSCRERAEEFMVAVDVLQHEFPPLPPSPVEEDDDEYSEILHPSPVQTPRDKADTLPEPFYRSLEPPGSDPSGSRLLNRPCPPEPPPHFEPSSSLKTRSMDAGFSRGHRTHGSGSRREIPAERRTLPAELVGPPRRRTFQKRPAQSPQTETMQTSCSLPETPIFTRGCDIPRTPHRRAPEVPSSARTTPRPGGLASSSYRRVGTGPMGQALVGAELLRLAGGPGRGWYPRHRQPRPASIEHLDRLAVGHAPWEAGRDSRKPLTLPPNLSPKFFHRSPREALRRVTSLLIRKGGSSKEPKKDTPSPTGPGEGLESGRHKRGFFKNLWKRSRHYSLEHQ